MSDDFYRIKRLPPYVIAEVNAMRAAARAGGEDIIDLGMGNPDLPPPDHVIEKLIEVTRKPDAHGYSQSKGIPGLRRAQANYYGRRFGVDLDPETEVVVTMGSKEGLASLATAITAPGRTPAQVPRFHANGFGHNLAEALDAVDAALGLSRPGAGRLVVIASDGAYAADEHTAATTRITALKASGCAALWLAFEPDPTPCPGTTLLHLTDPAQAAAQISTPAQAALATTHT